MRLSKARTGPFVLKLGFVFLCLSFGKLALAASVTLAWNPNSESNLAGYRIQYGTAPGIHPTTHDAGNQTTYTVSGLGPGTYYFVVLAYNASGLQSPPSNEVSVTITTSPPPPTNPSLTASPGSVGPGGNVTVSWSAIGNASVRDWIGHYPAAANDAGYTTWKYTSSCGQSPGGSALPSGSCVFAMPTVPGIYQFRLFTNDTYTRLAASGMVTVTGIGNLTVAPSAVGPGGTVTVSWNNVSGAAVKDWLGRYAGGSGDVYYEDWKYTSSCAQNPGGSAKTSGSCTFTMPLSPGTYEFRLFANDSYARLATSAPVMVGAP
jgi:Fibronectin type III domain